MAYYDIFFFSVIFFLIGVLAASFGFSFLFIAVAVALSAAIFLLWGLSDKKSFLRERNFSEARLEERTDVVAAAGDRASDENQRANSPGERVAAKENLFPANAIILAVLSFFILAGAGWYQWDDAKFQDIKISFNREMNFCGLVVDDPRLTSDSQSLTVKLVEPERGRVLLRTRLYPIFHYRDQIIFQGVVRKSPAGSYGQYLAKERINGLVDFPQVRLEKSSEGFSIKNWLFNLKHFILGVYKKVLPPEQAAFLSGLTFGETGALSQEFKKAMSLSGTSHLVALSGLHLTIVSVGLLAVGEYIFSGFWALTLTFLAISGFVAMTGFRSSAVRAAIMGLAVLMAKSAGRIYDPRNIIVLAAFSLSLFNPKVLVFDAGFQLSFLAVLGIVYLRPALAKLLRFKEGAGFLGWRENFLMTLSAQLAVTPLLIINFGNVSPWALAANLLILTAVPLTMTLGFLIGFVSFFSYFLSWFFAWPVFLLLKYEFGIIDLFAKIALPFSPRLGIFGVVIYYSFLIGVAVWAGRRQRDL